MLLALLPGDTANATEALAVADLNGRLFRWEM